MFSVNSSLSTGSTSKLQVCPRAAMMFEEGRYLYRTQVAFRAIKKKKELLEEKHYTLTKEKPKQNKPHWLLCWNLCRQYTDVASWLMFQHCLMLKDLLCTLKKRKIFPHLPTRKKRLTSLDLLNIACYYYHFEALYILLLLFTATSQQAWQKKKKNFNKWFVLSRQLTFPSAPHNWAAALTNKVEIKEDFLAIT